MARDQYIQQDLTTALKDFALVNKGTRCTEVLLLSLTPSSATPNVSVRIGTQGVPIPFVPGQFWFADDDCDAEDEGILLTAPAQPGVTANFYVAYGGGSQLRPQG